ncbi:MAG: DUF4303 domain-containing protein [bacterium]|nr:DUF4303 domain-containing protein [bacterium]
MMYDQVCEKFKSAMEGMCRSIDSGGKSDSLTAIGFITVDTVHLMGAFLLYAGDLPDDAELYLKLSPVEWIYSHDSSFNELSDYLDEMFPRGTETKAEYRTRVHCIFTACADVLEQLDLRSRYGKLSYLTFCGTDPGPVLVEEEEGFVRRLNTPELFEQWCIEMG